MKKVAVFIDNSNVYKSLARLYSDDKGHWPVKSYEPMILAKRLTGGRKLVACMFYCAPPPPNLAKNNPKAYAAQNKYYSIIEKQKGVTLKYAELKQFDGQYFEKNLDTQMTADIILMAAANKYDVAIVVSNDGDFVSAVKASQELNKKVEVGYFKDMASSHLRQTADLTRRLRPSYFKKQKK